MNNSAKNIAQGIIEGKSRAGFIALNKLKDIEDELSVSSPTTSDLRSLVIIYGYEGNKAIVVYPSISNARINILQNIKFAPQDLYSVLRNPEIIGDVQPSSISNRLNEEKNTLIGSSIIFIFSLFFLISMSSPNAIQFGDYLSNPSAFPAVESLLKFYSLIGQALLTIMTLFFTVFILFTISQNSELAKDKNLYRIGYFHKYIRDDRFITIIAGISLTASTLGLLLASSPLQIISPSINGQINELNSIVPFCFALAISTFFASLTSLSSYARRVIMANESNLVKEILDERLASTSKAQHNPLPHTNVNGSSK